MGPIVLAGLVLLGIAVILVIWLVFLYNGLVRLRNRFRNAFAQIDVQLKRRHDLIPNLVEVAKGYLSHERETLDAVTTYNTRRESFPINLIAGMFKFGPAVLFEVSEPGEREAVKVSF